MWRSVPASHRFKALVRWHNPAIGCRIKATKRGLSPHSVLYAGYVLMKKKILPKAGGWRYPSIKGHARPMFNLLFFRRFTFTGYFVAVAGIEPATPPSWVVASFLSAGDCGNRTRAYQLHGIPYIVILLRSPPPYKPHSRFGQSFLLSNIRGKTISTHFPRTYTTTYPSLVHSDVIAVNPSPIP